VSLKHLVFRLLGKDPEAVVVTFLSGPRDLALGMLDEIRRLVPDREHYAVTLDDEPLHVPGVTAIRLSELPGPLRPKRIGLAPVLYSRVPRYQPLRRAAWRRAPHRILAYNERLERHHLRLNTWIASWLFLHGVPLDRIFLRPSWLVPWKRDRSVWPTTYEVHEGRPLSPARESVAILSPYFPYPLSHGGAVRIFHILREAARDFDIIYFSFAERIEPADLAPVLALCAKVITLPVPRYREPRWSSLVPPEVAEFRVPLMKRLLLEHPARLLQVEYTQMASYGGDVLVEHDITQDLYRQIHQREHTLSSWWNWWRWRRYENKAIADARRVVVMSEKDRKMIGAAHVRVIPNGVDLNRFQPQPEGPEPRLLFVGSFRHFPNIVAYKFFTEEVWPCLRSRIPQLKFTAVAGPDPDVYWKGNTSAAPYTDERIELLGFVRDVVPLYAHCSLVVVPTKVSAGTNLKVLEAMAMERAVVSTTSGCAGLGLVHGESVWIADSAQEFAAGIETLLTDYTLRKRIATAARRHALQHFNWKQIGLVQKQLWNELLDSSGLILRPGRESDLAEVARIQATADKASHWEPEAYLTYHLWVAEKDSAIVGFAVHRSLDEEEMELLNIAVDPHHRRSGVATRLIGNIDSPNVLLEVRESNFDAQKLYQKLGFVEIGRREKYYTEPDETAIVMRLSQRLKRVKV